jgi:hypothetical protein
MSEKSGRWGRFQGLGRGTSLLFLCEEARDVLRSPEDIRRRVLGASEFLS